MAGRTDPYKKRYAGGAFEATHPLLGYAMRAAHPDDWPRVPHQGGPAPRVGPRSQIGVALWCAEVVTPHVPAAKRATFDAALSLTRAVLGGSRAYDYAELDAAAKACKGSDLALAVAQRAVGAARTLGHGQGSLVGGLINPAMGKTVLLLQREGTSTPPSDDAPVAHPRVRAHLAALDDLLLRLELEDMLGERTIAPRARIAGILHRDSAGGAKVTLWLARLEDGSYGLLFKLKARWCWYDGDRDSVLSTVPEARFAAVVEAALARDIERAPSS